MIARNSLAALTTKNRTSEEYEATEKWLKTEVESQMIAAAKEGRNVYEFVVHVSEANPDMIRKVLCDKEYSVLMWAEPIDAKPPYYKV